MQNLVEDVRWGSRGDAGGVSEGECVKLTVDFYGKESCCCGDVRGSRKKEITMEYGKRDFDTWLFVA